MTANCVVCETPLINSRIQTDTVYFECSRCGAYALSPAILAALPGRLASKKNARALLSHAIHKMSAPGRWTTVSDGLLQSIIDNSKLPSPSEQLTNLIVWLGVNQEDPGSTIEAIPQAIAAVGAVNNAGLGFVVSEAVRNGYVLCDVRALSNMAGPSVYVIPPMQLTMKGWELCEELRRGRASGRIAFMAMPYGIPEFDTLYLEHFRPAVAATGFTLKRLDEDQPAGLIDDRLRVEIRQSRFLVADLTTSNAGAYWEAGYAEGLGKPVIYACRQDVFDDKKTGPHFDTNHHLTVVWNPGSLEAAAAKLKDTIRATLPAEASLTDI